MPAARLVAGVDSSTQSVKVVVVDADSGTVVRSGRAPHPDTIDCDPETWWQALLTASSGLLDGVAAVGVAAQQHGMVALDADGKPVRPALLWNDTRAAADAADLVTELGGPARWAEAVGSVPVASFTVSKLRWLQRREPENAAKVEQVLLPHDWLTWRLGANSPPATDRGDASGTGYWSPLDGRYRPDLVQLALGHTVQTPAVAGPAETVGQTPNGALLSAGTGDNMAAALGLGAEPGDVVLSLGTSGTAAMVATAATADASGMVAGFADATGHWLPLVCTLNAARVLDAGAALLGLGTAAFAELARSAPPGAGGVVLVPYFDGERTPNLPDATGSLAGLTRDSLTPDRLARAFVEGVVCSLVEAMQLLPKRSGAGRVLLTGGAAASPAVQQVAAALLGPITLPEPAEYVAIGAARQAAWALAPDARPPDWPRPARVVETDPTPDVLTQYRETRQRLYPASEQP